MHATDQIYRFVSYAHAYLWMCAMAVSKVPRAEHKKIRTKLPRDENGLCPRVFVNVRCGSHMECRVLRAKNPHHSFPAK